jgi:uncharacterized protein
MSSRIDKIQAPYIRNLRETFVLNQLVNAGFEVNAPETGDFWIDDATIEVGGKLKKAAQVHHLPN